VDRGLAEEALPIGLAHYVSSKPGTAAGANVHWSDVAMPDRDAVAARREMQNRFARFVPQ
jgi:hypothetical protein